MPHLHHVGGGISIHAPRVGSDREQFTFYRSYYISIHAPRVGSDDSRTGLHFAQ